jgi:phage-related protein
VIIITDPKRSFAERVNKFLGQEFNEFERLQIGNQLEKVHTGTYSELIKTQYLKRIRGDLHEIRIKFKTANVRIFVALMDDSLYPLHIIKKKTDRIPLSDLELAYKRLSDLKFILRK